MIKLSPVLIVLYFLWKRELALVLSAAVTSIVCVMISIVAAGPQATVYFATEILPALLKGTPFFQNQSINGFISRLMADPALYYSLQEFPSPAAARLLTVASCVAVLGAVAHLTRPRLGPLGLRLPYEFSLVLCTILLVSSVSWDHNTVWLLPAFVVLLTQSSSVRLSRNRYWTVAACAGFAYVLMIVPTGWYGMLLHGYSGNQALQALLTLLTSLKLYAILLLSLSLALLLLGLDSSPAIGVPIRAEADARTVSL
jgi:alpha-1,2-mannosyltransferase